MRIKLLTLGRTALFGMLAAVVCYRLICSTSYPLEVLNFFGSITLKTAWLNLSVYLPMAFFAFSFLRKGAAFGVTLFGVSLPVIQLMISRGWPSFYGMLIAVAASLMGMGIAVMLDRKTGFSGCLREKYLEMSLKTKVQNVIEEGRAE